AGTCQMSGTGPESRTLSLRKPPLTNRLAAMSPGTTTSRAAKRCVRARGGTAAKIGTRPAAGRAQAPGPPAGSAARESPAPPPARACARPRAVGLPSRDWWKRVNYDEEAPACLRPIALHVRQREVSELNSVRAVGLAAVEWMCLTRAVKSRSPATRGAAADSR